MKYRYNICINILMYLVENHTTDIIADVRPTNTATHKIIVNIELLRRNRTCWDIVRQPVRLLNEIDKFIIE